MNAQEFHAAFEESFAPHALAAGLARLKGKTPKWQAQTPHGKLTFAFATNPKVAGLQMMMAGEFRLTLGWTRQGGKQEQKVSLFQYADDDARQRYAALQRRILEKFFAQSGMAHLRGIYLYSSDPAWLPRPSFEEFCYYVDAADARGWGAWYGTVTPGLLAGFGATPETLDDWCWRVLWPDRQRNAPPAP